MLPVRVLKASNPLRITCHVVRSRANRLSKLVDVSLQPRRIESPITVQIEIIPELITSEETVGDPHRRTRGEEKVGQVLQLLGRGEREAGLSVKIVVNICRTGHAVGESV